MERAVILVGCGKMGFSMLNAWVQSKRSIEIHAVEPNRDLRENVEQVGVAAYAASCELATEMRPLAVFLAIKPQAFPAVVPDYLRFSGKRTVFVSVAAGVTISRIEALLREPTPIVRTMPNTPVSVREGVMVSVANSHLSVDQKQFIDDLLQAGGLSEWLDREELIDAVTAVSGSGPAYVFHFIECLSEAGVRLGLPRDLSGRLALQTVLGASQLARATSSPMESLREQVTSKGGTTAAGMERLLEHDRLQSLIAMATADAHRRAKELGSPGD